MKQEIPYKIYLEEQEMPKQWYNVRADMKKKPAPILNPGTLKPIILEELSGIFCEELAKQELDDTTAYFDIPDEIRNFYKMYRPSPLTRAYCLEKKLDTPAHIYYKFEGNNTSGSHKLNSAIAQAYYAKAQGLKGVTTTTDTSTSVSPSFSRTVSRWWPPTTLFVRLFHTTGIISPYVVMLRRRFSYSVSPGISSIRGLYAALSMSRIFFRSICITLPPLPC